MKWRLWLLIPIALLVVAAIGPPMPTGTAIILKSPKHAQTFMARTTAVPVDPPRIDTVTFQAETTSTNFPGLYLGLVATSDLSSSNNWRVVWTNSYPRSTNDYAVTNSPGSWWTSNYWVTFTVTITNQTGSNALYRAFYHNDFAP